MGTMGMICAPSMNANTIRCGLPSVYMTILTRPVSKLCTTTSATPTGSPMCPTMFNISLPVPFTCFKYIGCETSCSFETLVRLNSVMADAKYTSSQYPSTASKAPIVFRMQELVPPRETAPRVEARMVPPKSYTVYAL